MTSAEIGVPLMAARETSRNRAVAELAAETLARRKFDGMLDRSGNATIWHTEAVVALVRHLGPQYVIVAWLHDLVEDTPITLDDLRIRGFSEIVIAAVDAITRRDGEWYLNYIHRCAENLLALEVKLADIRHNSFELRLRQLPQDEANGLRKRYARAEEILMERLKQEGKLK